MIKAENRRRSELCEIILSEYYENGSETRSSQSFFAFPNVEENCLQKSLKRLLDERIQVFDELAEKILDER